jgi:hypothetical protein
LTKLDEQFRRKQLVAADVLGRGNEAEHPLRVSC